jgi:hypothetical protein
LQQREMARFGLETLSVITVINGYTKRTKKNKHSDCGIG